MCSLDTNSPKAQWSSDTRLRSQPSLSHAHSQAHRAVATFTCQFPGWRTGSVTCPRWLHERSREGLRFYGPLSLEVKHHVTPPLEIVQKLHMTSGTQFDSVVSSSMPPCMCIYVPLCMKVHMYVMCTYMWKPKVNHRSHSSDTIHLILLSQGLSQAWIWQARPTRYSPIPIFPGLGIRATRSGFYMVLGIKLRPHACKARNWLAESSL